MGKHGIDSAGRHEDEDAPAAPRPWYRRPAPLACTALLAAGALAIGIPMTVSALPATTAAAATASAGTDASTALYGQSPYSSYGSLGSGGYGSGSSGYQGYGYGSGGTSTGSGSTMEDATTASADESTGLVLIETTLAYQGEAAAGTGMVLTSGGLILTNNHVVEGSTSISVTVASTGATYDATVVGTDPTDDVAVLQLDGASGLTTVTVDDDEADAVGNAVTAVGNASGGGVLMAADGEISQLDASVTTQAEGAVASETLDGMIQIVADVVGGDSGGALLDDDGEVIGMTTAASSGTTPTTAFAIPIDTALGIAQQIVNGDESGNVVLGYPAFLGVAIAQSSTSQLGTSGLGSSGLGTSSRGGSRGTTSGSTGSSGSAAQGATIAGVYEDTPAADAGLAAGDTITAVDGEAVTGTTLSSVLAAHDPGDTVTLTWVDSTGSSHSAAVTLIEGPVA